MIRYASGGSLLKHCDEDLSWGLGVSLGCDAEFECLPRNGRSKKIMVQSGDILIGEFGQMPHAVRVTHSTPPPWWTADTLETFGTKTRCNILFRQALSESQQRQLSEERAKSVYGMSLTELRERTGYDNSFLSVHLRHAALE